MNAATFVDLVPASRQGADRLGVFASVLCAIHCLVTPLLLLLMPALGRAWAHPASHWVMALVVVPLAILTVGRGYRVHRRRWVLVTGSLGIALVLVGAALPYLEALPPAPAAAADSSSNCDACCPSLQTNDAEQVRLVIPPASIVTTLGGLALVLTHLGNLCRCLSCRRPSSA